MAQHNTLGKWGENIAAELLASKGYAIVERNWRTTGFEIDIVASKGSRIIFVEVKTRRTPDIDPLSAINKSKINKMVRAANAYMQSATLPLEPQFDIVNIVGNEHDFTIEHLEDAFFPPARFYR